MRLDPIYFCVLLHPRSTPLSPQLQQSLREKGKNKKGKSKNTSKLNLRTHQNHHPPWSSQLHPTDAGMVQHMKICKCNPPYKQTERKDDHMIISLDAEKPLTKSNTPS